MLSVSVQQLGDASVLSCEGRIMTGDAYSSLRDAVLSQTKRIVFLDVARVGRIDAAGLGVLLGLREWAGARAIRFKLMNVTKNVGEILELTNLERVFEFCSVLDLLCLLHRAASLRSWRPEQRIPTHMSASRDCAVEAQANVVPVWRSRILAAS